MAQVRSHRPSPALIVAMLALVVAIAGTALADQDQLASTNQVSKKKVKRIANRQIDRRLPLGSEDIADGAVNAAKIQDESLTTALFSNTIPAARVTRVAAQSIPFQSNDETLLAFDAEEYDTAAMHDSVTANTRLTAPVKGIYTVTAQATWSNGAVGSIRALSVSKNQGITVARDTEAPVASGTLPMQVSAELAMEAGDYVEASVFHDNGGTLSIVKSVGSSPEFSLTWLAPGP